MSITKTDNFEYTGKLPDFTRQEYATIADMKAVKKGKMPEMYIAYCLEDHKVYLYNKNNEIDDTLGYWREFGAGGGSSESIQKTVMPEASETELGKVYQYIGTTTDNFTRGYFYLCTSEEEEQTVEITTVEQLASYINNSDLKVEVNTGAETEQLTAFVVTLTREVMMPEPPNIVEISHNYCYIYNDTVYMIDNEGTSGNVSNDTAITSENINLYMFSTEDMVTIYSWINIPTTEVPKSTQVAVLPEASAIELGNIYQFIGNSTEYTINGYFYECAITGSQIETHDPQTVEVLKYDIEHYPTGTIEVNTGSDTEELDCLLNYYVYNDTIYRADNETGNISTDTPLTTDDMVADEHLMYEVDAPVYGWTQKDVQPNVSPVISDDTFKSFINNPKLNFTELEEDPTQSSSEVGVTYKLYKYEQNSSIETIDNFYTYINDSWVFLGSDTIGRYESFFTVNENFTTELYSTLISYNMTSDASDISYVKKVDSLPENPTEGDQVSYNGYLYVATKTPFCYCWKNSSITLYTVDSPEFVTTSSVLYESSNNPPTSISNLSVFSGTITSVNEDRATIVYNGSHGLSYTENENGFEIVWKKSEIDTGDVCKAFGYPSFDFKKSDITSPGSSVSGFFSYNQELYAVTNSGVSYWNGSQWIVIDSGIPFYPTFFKGHWFFSYSSGSNTDPGIKKLENNHTLSVVTTKSDAGATFLASDDFNLYVSDGGGQKRSTNGITWSNQVVATYAGIAVVVNDDKKHFAGFFINARGPGNQFAVGIGPDGYVASWSVQTGTFSYPFKIDNKIYVTKDGVFGELWFYSKNTNSFEFKPVANAPAFTRLWKSGSYYFGIDSNNYFYGSSDFKTWTKVDRVSISGLINSPNCYGSIGDTVYFCTSDGTIYESTGNTYPIRDMQNYIEKQTISKDPFGRKMSLMPLSWKVTLDFVNDSLEEIYWKLYNMYYSQLEYPLAVNMISGKIESTLSSGEVAITTAQMSILNASYSAPTYQLKVITSDTTHFIRATLGADYDLSMYELSAGDDKPTKVTILYDYNHSS